MTTTGSPRGSSTDSTAKNLDLFAPRPQAKAELTVTQANNRAKQLLEKTLGRVTVVGEIADHKIHSGHHYFSLRDSSSYLSAVLFRADAARMVSELRSGMQVQASGRLTVYGPRGRYQLVADRVAPKGSGALQEAFEQLKRRLEGEGLFEPARRRALPLLPRRVAVLTSPTGAVIRDIVNVSGRRFPGARLLLVPCRVQGEQTAPTVVAGLEQIAKRAATLNIDVVIIARGGGSLEELWGFNDERVARAISACPIPVVSAVGHETDFTIADFVADVRAPTPSAAAEIVFPEQRALQERINRSVVRGSRAIEQRLQVQRHRLRAAARALGDGHGLVREQTQRLSDARISLERSMREVVISGRRRIEGAQRRLAKSDPRVRLSALSNRLQMGEQRLRLVMGARLERERAALHALREKLDALGPTRVLARGYSITLAADGTALRDAATVSVGDPIEIQLARGRIGAQVGEIDVDDAS